MKYSKKFINKILNIRWSVIYINGIETIYEVSDDGFIKNRESKKLLKLSKDKRGYNVISLHVNGKIKTKLVHRLVAEAFIPNPKNKPTVNHIDGNKQNNHYTNLEWMTHKENINHAIITGLRDLKGIKSPSNIYTEKQVHAVCKMLEEGRYPKEISEKLNVSINLINRIKYLGKWKHISSRYNINFGSQKISHQEKNKIISLLSEGKNYDNILEIMKFDKTKSNRRIIYNIKRKLER